MKNILKFLCLLLVTLSLNSCVVYDDMYSGYRHHTTYRVIYETPHHHHVIKKKPHKPKKHYKNPYQNRRKPSNNRNYRR